MLFKTQVINLQKTNNRTLLLDPCVKALHESNLVAFPTETVYWLWANALDEHAVSKIFKTKNRPQDNPLIVHIASKEQFVQLTKRVPKEIYTLIDIFWPGPLTVIVPKADHIPDIVTAWLDTVAIRFPAHPVAQQLIFQSNLPLVAPSANISWKPSPTRAKHVFSDLDGKIPFIVDGWPCTIWIESSVVGFNGKEIVVYRQWAITHHMLEKASWINVVSVSSQDKQPPSPGMKYIHYSPNATISIIPKDQRNDTRIQAKHNANIKLLSYSSPEEMAHLLFHDFRLADESWYTHIYVREIEEKWIWKGVMERLHKAAGE